VPSKSRHVSIVPSDNVDDSKVIGNVHIFSKITSIIEEISVDFDEGHAFYEGISEVVDAIIKSDISTVDPHVHDNCDIVLELVEPSVPSQISMYSFTHMR